VLSLFQGSKGRTSRGEHIAVTLKGVECGASLPGRHELETVTCSRRGLTLMTLKHLDYLTTAFIIIYSNSLNKIHTRVLKNLVRLG